MGHLKLYDIWSIFFRFVTVLALITSSAIVGHYFSDIEISKFYLIVPICTIFTMTLISPLTIFKINKAINLGGDFNQLLPIIYCYLIPVGLFSIIVFFAFTYTTGNNFTLLLPFYIFIEIVFATVISLVIQIRAFTGKLIESSILNFFVILTLAIAPISSGYFFGWDIASWLIGLIAARFFQLIFFNYFYIESRFCFHIIRKGYLLFYNSILKDKYSLFLLFINSGFGWLSNNFVKIFIGAFIGLELAAPYLFFLGISTSLASASESLFKSILDRRLYLDHFDNNKKFSHISYIYFFILVVGSIIILPASNLLSNNRFVDFSPLAIFFFVLEISRLFLAYVLTKHQILGDYKLTIFVNLFTLILYSTIFCTLLYYKADIYLLCVSLFFVSVIIIITSFLVIRNTLLSYNSLIK